MTVPADVVLLTLLSVCLYTDLRERKIYNKVVFPAVAVGLILSTAQHGISGLISGASGLGMGILLFLLPFALGGLGAGDVKLLGAVGALKGPLFVCYAALGTALTGGVIAIGVLIRQRRVWATVKRLAFAGALFLCRKKGSGALLMLERTPYSALFPYGAAIFLGTILAYWFGNCISWQ